jgi:hypothetical protein
MTTAVHIVPQQLRPAPPVFRQSPIGSDTPGVDGVQMSATSAAGEADAMVGRACCDTTLVAGATALGLEWPECACTGMAQPSDNRTTNAVPLIAWTRIPTAVTTLRRFVLLSRTNGASHRGRSTAFGGPCAFWLPVIGLIGLGRANYVADTAYPPLTGPPEMNSASLARARRPMPMEIVDHESMGMSTLRGTGEMRVIGRQIVMAVDEVAGFL